MLWIMNDLPSNLNLPLYTAILEPCHLKSGILWVLYFVLSNQREGITHQCEAILGIKVRFSDG
jgi:hypothetical protein